MRTAAFSVVTLSLVIAAIGPVAATAQTPLTKAFTYQGELKVDGVPHPGPTVDLEFLLYDAPTDGTLIDSNTRPGVPISDGLFYTEVLFEAANAYIGEARWLEIWADGTQLLPRQALTAAPFAAYAMSGAGGSSCLWNANGDAIYYNGGNVGIGVTSPDTRLSVGGDIALDFGSAIKVTNTDFNARTILRTGWGVETNDYLDLYTPGSDQDDEPRVRITDAGKVGIGTLVPTSELHVVCDNEQNADLAVENTYATGDTRAGVWLKTLARTWRLENDGALDDVFKIRDQTASANRLVIDAAGNVGIGTDDPLTKEHIRHADLSLTSAAFQQDDLVIEDEDAVLGLYSNPSGVVGSVISLSEINAGNLVDKWGIFRGTNSDPNSPSNYLRFTYGASHNPHANATILELKSSGNTGIGTSSPTAKLHVSGDSDTYVKIEAPAASRAGVRLGKPGDSFYAGIGCDNTTGDLDVSSWWGDIHFNTNINEAMSIVGGRVGIGTPTPDNRLEVIDSSDDAAIWAENSGQGFAAVFRNPTAGTIGSTLWLDQRGNGDLITGSNGTTVFQVRNDGRTIVPVLEITGGSDLSEQFDVNAAGATPQPGMVVCIDPENPGRLVVSTKAYDRAVAGVISGAGGVQTGMFMGQRNSAADGQHPVALTGRVYVNCDTSNGPIHPGDLLTTSDTYGHGMKVTDHSRAHGAIIGKAMTSLESGEGLVLVLVSLQ